MSPDKGVVVDGQEYRLSPQDIDLDCCAGFNEMMCQELETSQPAMLKMENATPLRSILGLISNIYWPLCILIFKYGPDIVCSV